MNYAFTVNYQGQKVTDRDYQPFWILLMTQDIQVVYMYKHGGSTKEHTHYHGVIYSKKFIDYRKIMLKDFSIKINKILGYDSWHQYCQHEQKTEIEELRKENADLKGQLFSRKIFKPFKPLMKIQLFWNI